MTGRTQGNEKVLLIVDDNDYINKYTNYGYSRHRTETGDDVRVLDLVSDRVTDKL